MDLFLKRNEEYAAISRKKQELFKQNMQTYDLKTGEKLFSPKIIEPKQYNYHTVMPVKQLKRTQQQQETEVEVKTKVARKERQKPMMPSGKSSIFSKQQGTNMGLDSRKEELVNGITVEDIEEGYRQYS